MFYLKCDPEKKNLCLYGLPNETSEVGLPVEEVPPDLPEPTLGINVPRDGMNDKDWLSLAAVHSDSWLLSVAFYYGTTFFDQESRKRLFSMINSIPTIFEVVTGTDKRQPKDFFSKNSSKSNKYASKWARLLEPNPSSSKIPLPVGKEWSDGEEEKEQEDHESTLCGAFSENYGQEAGPGAVRLTPEIVFQDFWARQQGLLKAFTTEVDRFYLMCDPKKKNLCLYGLPSETWKVSLPVEEFPPDLPEPTLGINFPRDGMNAKDWLSCVAAHTDSWLLSVAFYYGARFGFDKESRKRLFSMINSVPTVYEVVMGIDKKQRKEEIRKCGSKSSKSASKRARQLEPNPRSSSIPPPEDKEVSDRKEDHESTLCGETRGALDLLRLE